MIQIRSTYGRPGPAFTNHLDWRSCSNSKILFQILTSILYTLKCQWNTGRRNFSAVAITLNKMSKQDVQCWNVKFDFEHDLYFSRFVKAWPDLRLSLFWHSDLFLLELNKISLILWYWLSHLHNMFTRVAGVACSQFYYALPPPVTPSHVD